MSRLLPSVAVVAWKLGLTVSLVTRYCMVKTMLTVTSFQILPSTLATRYKQPISGGHLRQAWNILANGRDAVDHWGDGPHDLLPYRTCTLAASALRWRRRSVLHLWGMSSKGTCSEGGKHRQPEVSLPLLVLSHGGKNRFSVIQP